MKKIIAITVLACMLFTLAGCDKKAKVMEGYGDYVAEVGKMTLVTDKLIEGGDATEGTAYGCTIFAEKDGEFKEIVQITGESTGFPLKYEEGVGFWRVSHNYIQNLVYFDGAGVLEAVEFIEEQFDDQGNPSYTYYLKGKEAQETDKAKFDEMMEKYNSAESIVFKKK